MTQLVFLIGMPGVGKTFLGERVAKALGFGFVDMDSFIEAQEQQTVSEIFKTKGEPGFREIETLALSQIIEENEGKTIVACGGGTPCFYDNLENMRQAGKVIYLKAEIATLLRHLEDDSLARPILMNEHVDRVLMQLHQSRSVFYEQAHRIIEVESLSVPTFAQIIQKCLEEH